MVVAASLPVSHLLPPGSVLSTGDLNDSTSLVWVERFELPTTRFQSEDSAQTELHPGKIGREEKIRTSDPTVPDRKL